MNSFDVLRRSLEILRPRITFFLFIVSLMGLKRGGGINLVNFIILGSFSVFHGLLVFAVNDYFDFDTDQHQENNDFKGSMADEERRSLLKILSVLGFIGAVCFIFFLSFQARFIVFGIMAFSFIYSMPPLRLKAKPIFDSISNACWILLTFLLGYTLAGERVIGIGIKPLWLSGILGGFHALASLPDIEADRKADIMTTGRLLGWRPTILGNLILVVVALVLVSWSTLTFFALLIYAAFCLTIFFRPESEMFYRALKICWAAGILYAILWIAV